MNVKVSDILSIKPGQTKAFLCSSGKACTNASALLSIVQRTDKPKGISRYSRKIDFDQNIINITAHAE